MSLRRIDAPCSCTGCHAGRTCDAIPSGVSVVETEHGPRLREKGESVLDAAYRRYDEEARRLYANAPPEGAMFRRESAPAHVDEGEDLHVDTAGMSSIDAAYAREEARARAAHRAGPPAGAMIRK